MYLKPKVKELQSLRKLNGLSMHQLSLKAGLGGQAICRIENEITKSIHPLRAKEIARVLDCEVKDIFESR